MNLKYVSSPCSDNSPALIDFVKELLQIIAFEISNLVWIKAEVLIWKLVQKLDGLSEEDWWTFQLFVLFDI